MRPTGLLVETFHYCGHPVHRCWRPPLGSRPKRSSLPTVGGILDETDFFCAIEAKEVSIMGRGILQQGVGISN